MQAVAAERRLSVEQLASEIGISRRQYYRWIAGAAQVSDVEKAASRLDRQIVLRFGPYADEEPKPTWADQLMTREEVHDLVKEVEERVTAAIEENRRITRQAIVGDDPTEEALVEILTEELRPVFEGMAAQFQAAVEQLLDARLGASGSVE